MSENFMFYKKMMSFVFMALYCYPCPSFSDEIISSVYYGHHLVILDMPQEIQDFFETADACELRMSYYDKHLDKMTFKIVEDEINRDCADIERNLDVMKDKYKGDKDYSVRLAVYDDTVFLYKEYLKKYKRQNNNGD